VFDAGQTRRDTGRMSTDNAALVRDGFQAFLRGDVDALRKLIDPDAQWLWWEPIPGDCHDRDKILATLRDRQQEGVVTGLKDVVEGGEKVFVEVTGPRLAEWGLPDGQASMVVTVRDGRIVRLQDHRSRTDALVDAGLARRPALDPPTPLEHTEPGWDQVTDLVPFIHVTDVEASIAFYEHLGFRVTATHPGAAAPKLDWASLEAAPHGSLMLARADRRIDAPSGDVLFYLFARDLFGLRDRLLTAGIDAGAIHNGAPAPTPRCASKTPTATC
jgi:ketosteroid isomerase-like protein